MADGTDKAHALRAGRSMLQECHDCHGKPLGQHVCAFLTGTFDQNNWNCGTWARLERTATRFEGSELEVLLHETPNGTTVVWFRRVGNAQRVRKALAFTANFQLVPVTLELLESIHVRTA
jgi:hypothetical protein